MFRDLTLQISNETNKSVLRGRDSVQETILRLALQRGQDAPKDQEDHHGEYDADGKFRPQFAAKQYCLETEGCEKRYRAVGPLY